VILHVYFARRFGSRFFAITGGLFCLVLLVDLIDQLRRFSDTEASFAQIAQLTVMKSMGTLDEIIPLTVLLATVALFTGLARTSEMVVARAAGRSALRALIAPGIAALIIGLLTVSALGPVVSALTNRYSVLSESYRTGAPASLSVSSEGLWLRQGTAADQTVIWAERSNADASVLFGVSFLTYAPGGGPERRIDAEQAALLDGAWALTSAKEWILLGRANPEAEAVLHASLSLPTTLTADRIREAFGTSAGVSVWDMPAFIAQLEQAGFSALRHKVWFQSELARPLFFLGMMLIGAGLTMRHTRFGGTGAAVITAVLLGFGLYFARSFASILGENGQLAVGLAAWSVPAATVMLAIGLLLHVEDG